MKVFYNKKISPFNIIIGLAIAAAVMIAMSNLLFSGSQEDTEYVDKIQQFRLDKNKSFREGEDSPIEYKEKFDGLAYFYPDPDFILEAKIQRIRDSVPLTILRSDGKQDNYVKYAFAIFELENKEHKVVLLKKADEINSENVFLPFSDQTSGRETYPGGRYLDLVYKGGNKLTIDFNLAYNPYCVYNYRYSCPLPPRENFIDARVRAGEKMYHE